MSDETKFPSQLAERFQIRMPEGLRDQIRIAAEANGRSMNTEIILRLEASLAPSPRTDLDTIENASQRIADILAAERERMEKLLSSYVDFEQNSFGNIGDFAQSHRRGYNTRFSGIDPKDTNPKEE